MAYEPITLTIDVNTIKAAERALRYRAQMEAGQSQAPDLIAKEETDDWKFYQDLRKSRIEAEREAELVRKREEVLAMSNERNRLLR